MRLSRDGHGNRSKTDRALYLIMILVILTKGQVLNNSYFEGFCAFNFFLNQNEELKSNNFKSFFFIKNRFLVKVIV